jgi:hypothetical protein
MRNSGLFFIVVSLLFYAVNASAQNPILKGYADPHMKVWDGKMYISVGKDRSPDLKKFEIIYWSIYSTTDLVNWKLETHIMPEDTWLGKGSIRCWASDITEYKGKYYFYFSNGGIDCGVLVADNPGGPYKDVLKKALIPHHFSTNHEYDPTILEEGNGERYLIYGRNGVLKDEMLHYQIVKLSDDMTSLEGKSYDLLTDYKYGFGGENRARDHQYFHKHNDLYYLSCAGAYRTSKNKYGPFENERHTGQNGHSSFCEFNGQTYHMSEWSCEPFDARQYRQVCMTYLHYKDNGDMVDDVNFLQKTAVAKEGKYYKTGVGNYNANWELIEAEWFFKRVGFLEKKECPVGGFEIQNIQNGDVLNFPNVKNMDSKSTISFRISSVNKVGAIIEIRRGSEKGDLLGTCDIPNTGTFTKYETVSCSLKNTKNQENLYFVFKGDKGELVRLDWFNIE